MKVADIPEASIKSAIEEIERWYSVRFSPAQMREFVARHPRYADEVAFAAQCGLDTIIREGIMRQVAQELGFERWPIFGDGEDALDRFWAQFVPKAQMAGYEIVGMEETVH